MTPQEFTKLSGILSEEIGEKFPSVQFESKFEDGQGKFFVSKRDYTYCLGFNASTFNASDFNAQVTLAIKYALIAAKSIQELPNA